MKRLALWVCWLTAWTAPATMRAQDAPTLEPTPGAAGEEPATYGARARAQREPEPELDATQPTEAETTALQSNLGSSFSLAESLPGSVPVFSGVPYLIVRGATPAATATYYDGLLIPSLFHIALGPAVIHPHLLGSFAFHPGVSPAQYGRHTGGTVVAGPPRMQRDGRTRRELELTLLDASGYLHLPEARTTIAWRIGDPGLLMNLLGLDATLNYYDYQVRHEATVGPGTELVLFALGAGDELGDRVVPEDDISLTFHRVLARITQRSGRTRFGSQLVLGYDASMLGRELNGEAVRAVPSVYVEHAVSSRVELRAGADLLASHVSLRRRESLTEESMFGRGQSFSLDPEDFIDGQPYASYPARSASGIYGELRIEPTAGLKLQLGARADVWLTGSDSELALGPSGRVSYAAVPELTFYAAAGLAHATHGSPVPLPGLTDVAIDDGLERALQAEAGVTWKVLPDLQLEAAYFHHRYFEVVYLELILDCPGNTDPNAISRIAGGMGSVCRGRGLPTADGLAQGLELFLKRDLTERISGFVSYTLSFAEAIALDGTPFTPQSDVRHLVNAVLRLDLGAGFAFGARLHYRSGKMGVNTLFDTINGRFERVEQRLPSFVRLDVNASYAWNVSFGRLQATVGVQNVTASSEALDRDCLFDPGGEPRGSQLPVLCRVDYQRAILLPNLGLRAEM